MKQRSSWLRRIVIWTGPIAAMAVLVVGGFLYWVLGTTPGGRWALVTATMQMGGSVSGVSGSVWKGLEIGHLALPVGNVAIDVTDLQLQVQWAALMERQLHIQNVSMGSLDIALAQTDEPEQDSEPFVMPDIPVQLRVDRLALGEFSMSINDAPIPVNVADLATSLYLDRERGQLRLSSMNVGHEQADIRLEGDVQVSDLNAPWPFDVVMQASVQGKGPDSMLCARRYLPTLPLMADAADSVAAADGIEPADTPVPEASSSSPDNPAATPLTTDGAASVRDFDVCSAHVQIALNGSLNDMVLTAQATGQGMDLDAMLNLTPSAAFPLKDARIDLILADESSLHAQLDWESEIKSSAAEGGSVHDHVSGTVRATRLNLGELIGPSLPVAVLTTSGRFDVQLKDRNQILSSRVELDVAQGSVWNGESLQGLVKASLHTAARSLTAATDKTLAQTAQATSDAAFDDGTSLTDEGEPSPSPSQEAPDPSAQTAQVEQAEQIEATNFDWRTVQVRDVEIDVRLGQNHVQATGGFGTADSDLVLNVDAPALSAFWPALPGGLDLDAQLGGSVRDHTLSLDAIYTPDDSVPDTLGVAPARVNLDVDGGWVVVSPPGQSESGAVVRTEGWIGQILGLEAQHAGLGVTVAQTPSLRVVPGATEADGLWRLGSANIGLSLDTRSILQFEHVASSGGAGGQWATEGQISRLVVSQALIEDIQQVIGRVPGGTEAAEQEDRGGVKIRGASQATTEIELALDWDLSFDQALSGTLNARHLSGDVMVPAEPPFALGLQTLALDLSARPLGDGLSQLDADLNVVTADMGRASATVVARLRAAPGGGFALEPAGTTVDIDANIDDLGWASLFAGDAMEFGGQVDANVTLASRADGGWDSTGTVTGTNIRIVRIDDGIRLLDGTLAARLENDRIILEKLEFPARLRVEPQEWRTAEWVSTNPDARDGYLRLTGDWTLSEMAGDVDVELHRYPVLQRSDRYGMVTGRLHVHAALPALSITGRVEADAGWIDLDMLGGIPTVDSDVVIIRAGDDPAEVNVPMDISMDIEVDLGPRVYLTGYGVNSGLVGNMRIVMIDNKLTAIGALRTRGGAIEAYGQRLQLRRGTITFQGDITSPILSIEALRTGLAIEAGVRVSGTARRPAIDLVSYPDVSDIEKLSWLLFGHGPDESGGDMALLLSVGTSFLGDGEPFYRKFGIDELSLQSGDIGSAGSILPAESVVSGLNSGASDLERQFISASKGIAAGFTLSVRQALSDAGTVGRVSYRLARGLTAELSVGSVNGLALVYRWFSRN